MRIQKICGATQALAAAAALVFGQISASEAAEAAPAPKHFDIGRQLLANALNDFARQSDRQILFSTEAVSAKSTEGIRGTLEPEAALQILLKGTGLTFRVTEDQTILVESERKSSASANSDIHLTQSETTQTQSENTQNPENQNKPVEPSKEGEGDKLTEIIVTGTNIRGAQISSQTITLRPEEIRLSGQSTLGEALRSLPQNSSGGQNPGIARGVEGIGNANLTGASAPNLRGLGPDATLTLLNGRRLAYDASSQSIDVSMVPLEAIERVEIVPDGASAIYGSDAVAGVINVKLRNSFEGLATNARIGAATGGGYFQQQYGATTGAKWHSGGAIITGNFERNSSIESSQRNFTSYMLDPNTIYPEIEQYGGVLSVHQSLVSGLTAGVDAIYSHRQNSAFYTLASSRLGDASQTTSFQIAPQLTWQSPIGWEFRLGGTYASDRSHYNQEFFSLSGSQTDQIIGCYCNKLIAVDLATEGPLVRLGSADIRVALGGGYRKDSLRAVDNYDSIVGSRSSKYVFTEFVVPFISPADGSIVDHLTLNAAARYEDYSDSGNILTPKIGMNFGPTNDFDIRLSWGKSYKTPTLLQQNQASFAFLYPAADVGGVGFPSGATALLLFGGNRSLKPERASTFSATVDFHPAQVPGLNFEVSYFDIRYRDRVVSPLTRTFDALSNSIYEEFISRNPSAASQAAAIAVAGGFFNLSPGAYDPASTIAIVSDVYTNVARQRIRGLDVSASYVRSIGRVNAGGNVNVSYLKSSQIVTSDSASVELAGTIYHPPHLRYRLSAFAETGPLTLTGVLNYTGSVLDNRNPTTFDGASMSTVDLSVVYRPGGQAGIFSGLSLYLSAQNILDEKPPYARPRNTATVNFDSTNYSAIGRVLSFTIRKLW